ncbi:MAG: carboxypeptidase-like regulatory domain-containing protein [Planctomycetes bacterium]|nr:carboxypeptidase-like regulatory domain-containing protein [Planctomycetota bacterium]
MSAARRRGLAAAALAALAAGGLALVLLGGDEDGPAPARTTHAHGGPGPVVVNLAPSTAGDPAASPEAEAAAVASDAVLVPGVALLDLEPLVDAALRFTAGARRVEVVTGRGGVFGAGLPPGDWTVEAPGLPDVEQVVCDMTSFSVPAALARAVAAPPPRLGSRAYPRPTLRVVGPDGAGADATPRRITVRPGGALLLRFEAPWVLEAQVVDALTGAPLPGATATAELQEPYQRRIVATAGADGALRLVAPRTYAEAGPAATFEAPGYAAAMTVMGARDERLRVGLRRPLRLEARVRGHDGRPVQAAVTAWARLPDAATGGRSRADRSWSVTCDAEGRFVLDDLPPGAGNHAGEGAGPHAAVVSLLVVHADHARTRLQRVLVAPDGPPLEVALVPLVPLVGRVVGPAGQPLGGAEVRTYDQTPRPEQSDVTDAQGRFALADVPARSIVLQASRIGFATARVAVTPPVEDVVLRLEEVGPPLRGRVVLPGGEPVVGVGVVATVDEGDAREEHGPAVVRHHARTDDAGAFSIDGAPAGRTFLVRAAGRGFDVHARGVVAGGEPVTLRLPPAQDLVVTVEAAGAETALVTVLDADGGRVLDDRARRQGGTLLATSSVPASGRLGVVLRASGFAPALRWFDAPPGQTVAMTVPLEAGGGVVALRVRWPQGAAPALRVAYRDPALGLRLEETFSPPSVADLPLRLVGVGEGAVRLELEARLGERTWPLAPVEAVVRAGETTTIDLDLAAAPGDDPPR